MAKPPSDNPRTGNLSLKLTKEEAEELDRKRGSMSKSAYVRKRLFGGRR